MGQIPRRTNDVDTDQRWRTLEIAVAAPLTTTRHRREPEAEVHAVCWWCIKIRPCRCLRHRGGDCPPCEALQI